jgi:hypothetical protein
MHEFSRKYEGKSRSGVTEKHSKFEVTNNENKYGNWIVIGNRTSGNKILCNYSILSNGQS